MHVPSVTTLDVLQPVTLSSFACVMTCSSPPAMEPLLIPQRDEEEDFSKHLLELLGSPVSRHYNGISNLFSPDLNAGSSYGEFQRVHRAVHC